MISFFSDENNLPEFNVTYNSKIIRIILDSAIPGCCLDADVSEESMAVKSLAALM